MFRILIVLGMLVALDIHAASNANDFLGMSHPPLPEGCKSFGGTMLTSPDAVKVLGTTTLECDGVLMQLLNEKMGSDGAHPLWKVTDVLRFPKIPKGFQIPTLGECSFDGRRDYSIFVVAKWRRKRIGAIAEIITHAWRVNKTTIAFERLPVKRVTCRIDEDRD